MTFQIELKWLSSGAQAITAEVKGFADRFDELSKKVNESSGLVGTAIQGAIAFFGIEKLKEYSDVATEASRSQAQLAAELKSTGQYSPQYLEDLKGIAEEMERLTGTEPSVTRGLERILIQFGVGAQDMRRFTMLTLDMSAAMGIDAAQAARRLGLVLEGNTERIRGFTVQVDKSLPLSERIASVFEQVNRQVGGQKIAQFEASPKGIIDFELALRKMKETLGSIFNQFVGGGFFKGMADGLRQASVQWSDLLKKHELIAGALKDLTTSVGVWAGKHIAAIGATVVALSTLVLGMKTMLGLGRAFSAFWELFAGVATRAIWQVNAQFLLLTTNLRTMAASWLAVISTFFAAWEAGRFVGELMIGGHTIDQWAQGMWNGIFNLFSRMGIYLKSFWDQAKVVFGEGITGIELLVRSGVLRIASIWNKIPGAPKIDTTGIQKGIAEAEKKLADYVARDSQIEAKLKADLAASDARNLQNNRSIGFFAEPAAGKSAQAPAAGAQQPNDEALRAAFAPQLARIAKEYAAASLALAAKAAKDNTQEMIKNEEALYKRGLVSFEDYLKARQTAARTEFASERLAAEKEISVIEDQLKLKRADIAEQTKKGDLAEAAKLTKEKNDLQLKLESARNELRKLERRNAQVQLDLALERQDHNKALATTGPQTQISDIGVQRALVEASSHATRAEKTTQLIPLLEQEAAANQELVDIYQKRQAETKDDEQKLQYQQQINQLLQRQIAIRKELGNLNDTTSFAGQALGTITEWQDRIGTFAQQFGRAFSSTIGNSISSISQGIEGLVTGTMKWGKAMQTIGAGIVKGLAKSFSDFVSETIVKFALMGIKWLLTHVLMKETSTAFQTAETAEEAAHTTARVAIHTAGEGAKTGASGVGAIARGAIRLGETIFHGIQVAARVVAHIAGEAAMTVATVVGSGARIVATIAEAIPNLIKAAFKAASAVADIPYVGPILAVAAIGAVLAAGFSALHKRAEGGYSPEGQMTLVGERGPELRVFNSPGTVISSEKTQRMFASAAGLDRRVDLPQPVTSESSSRAQAVRRGLAGAGDSSSSRTRQQTREQNFEFHFWDDKTAMTKHIEQSPDVDHVVTDKMNRNVQRFRPRR